MRKTIMLLLCTTVIILNSFVINAKTKYNLEDDFREAGNIIGKFEGYSDGFIYSIGNDLNEEDLALYIDNLVKKLDPDIEAYLPEFSLNSEEEDEFIEGFEEGFKEGFNDGYNGIDLVIEYELEDFETLGQQYAEGYGVSMAVRDYESRRTKDSERAYSEFSSRENVYKMLDMHIISSENSESMQRTIRDAFISAYDAAYDELYINEISQEGTYINLFLSPISFSYLESISETINGAKATTTMPGINIEAEEFTFYEEAFLNVSKTVRNQFLPINNKKVMTDSYTLTIFNPTNQGTPMSVNAEKPFKISFNGVGSDRAGIYKMTNGEWTYQYTEFEADRLEHIVHTGDYNGGVYAVLIDYDYPLASGINLSWAYEELYTYLRREYLLFDYNNYYDPTKEITRKEFAYLIYKNSYDGDYFSYESKTYEDKETFGSYELAINYCYNKGYLYGVSETEFDPNGTLTFEQAEIIMQRVLKNNFTYETISDSMLNNKYKKSNYTAGKDQKITREEAVYMFYHLFK